MSSNFWESAMDELDDLQGKNNFLRAKVASGAYWPYLSQARSEAEFEGRLDLSIDRIAAAVPSEQLSSVVGSLREDFKSLLGERTAAREAALQATAEALAAKALPIPHVHVTKHSGFFQVDHVASNTVQNNIHRGPDEDAAMNEARKFGQFNDMPVFVNGEPDNEPLEKEAAGDHAPGAQVHAPWNRGVYTQGFNHGKENEESRADKYKGDARWAYENGYTNGSKGVEKQASAEFFNQATQSWEKVAYIDPSDAQRYNHYPNYNGPVDNGDLQGPDGFPVDLAQGEQRTPDAYARQLTPGQWEPGTPWVQNDMNLQPGPANVGGNAGWAREPATRTAASNDGMGFQPNSNCHRDGQLIPSHSWMTDTKNYPVGSKASCPSCGETVTSQQDGGGALVFHHEPGHHFRLAVTDGGEGIVPKPGQNPHYFEPGNDLQSDGGFPVDPSLDEEANNRVNQYGGVPPIKSGGSDEGVNGPYSQNLNATAVQYGPHFNPAHASNVLVYHTGYTHGQEGQGFKQLSKNDHARSYALGFAHGTEDQGLSSTASLPQFFDPTVAGRHEKMPEWMGTADLFEEGRDHALHGMEPQRNHDDYFRGYQVGMNNRQNMYATAADVRTRPSLVNPNGSGDDYGNRTWDAQTQQRPMQDPESRNSNTPTLPQEPIRVVDTNNPGATDREEEDED